METTTTAETIEAAARELGLSMSAVFVPFSQSRNRGEKMPSLNWLVTIKRGERDVITTDYMAGSGHCPAYKKSAAILGKPDSYPRRRAIERECETGLVHMPPTYGDRPRETRDKILPSFAGVLYSLASDCDVLDAGGFEQWAADLGYDSDSRKAEGVYRACLDIALKFRAALGEDGLAKLREACQGY